MTKIIGISGSLRKRRGLRTPTRVEPSRTPAYAKVFKVTSFAIPCAGSGEPTDGVEEYAAGGSGLQNLGGGNYQLNWATSKG